MDSETDILILKKIKPNDLNISTSELEKNDNNEKLISIKDNFKARFFAFLYKNIKTKSLLFKPIGLKLDDEKIPEWNIFLVLMQSFSKENDFNKKLIKVCLPKDKEDDYNFAVILPFDKNCLEYVNFANSNDLFSEKKNDQSLRLNNYQNNLLNKNINVQYSYVENKENLNNKGSFIEKSQNVGENNSTEKSKNDKSKNKKIEKLIGIESLVTKFSVEELNKIKSLIKFAKKNKVMDNIYQKKGDINLVDLINQKNSKNVIMNMKPINCKYFFS